MEEPIPSGSKRIPRTPSIEDVEQFHDLKLNHLYNGFDEESAAHHQRIMRFTEKYFPELAKTAIEQQVIDKEGKPRDGVFFPKGNKYL